MCSICGGTKLGTDELRVFHNSRDRGRDYSNMFFRNGSWVCNHRAIPTTECKNPEHNQPFGTDYKIVHNGVISNDKELGNTTGEIDSSVLSKVLDCSNIIKLRDSLSKIKGSYALAILKPNGHFYLACNYKPLFYAIHKNGKDYVFSSYKSHLELSGDYSRIERVKPYSVIDMELYLNNKDGQIENGIYELSIPRKQPNNAIVICSGGLDSTAVAAYACHKYGPENVTLIHYCYGCIAESKETECIKKIANYLKCKLEFIKIDMSFMNGNSALFKKEEDIHKGVEGSEYAYEWVPARNLIMMSLAVGYAEANGFGNIYLGTNLEEGGAYPDNDNQFIKDFDACLWGAVQNGVKVQIHTPVGNLMKHEIVAFGNKYNAPFHLTWSCYKKGEHPCGECGPCFMRRTAFRRNGIEDPLQYPKMIGFDEVESDVGNIVQDIAKS